MKLQVKQTENKLWISGVTAQIVDEQTIEQLTKTTMEKLKGKFGVLSEWKSICKEPKQAFNVYMHHNSL